MEATIHDDYPGIEVMPPAGTVGMHDTEGEWSARWKKVGDKYTIISLDGVAIEHGSQPNSKVISERPDEPMEESPGDELRRLASSDY